MDVVARLRGACKRYGATEALRGVDLEVPRDHIHTSSPQPR